MNVFTSLYPGGFSFWVRAVLRVLRGQRAQKCPDQVHVAVGEMELGISLVELQRVAGLAVRREIDPLIKTALRIGLVAVIAIELLPFHRRNVRGEMAAVVEAQRVGIGRLFANELELRMLAVKRREDLRVTHGRSRPLKNDLLRLLRTEMENLRLGSVVPFFAEASMIARSLWQEAHWESATFFIGPGPRCSWWQIEQARFSTTFGSCRSYSFFVPNGGFFSWHSSHLRSIEWKIDPVMEPVFDDALEFRERQVVAHRRILVVALGAILLVLRVMAGNSS